MSSLRFIPFILFISILVTSCERESVEDMKTLNVLFIGSSFGVNTVAQFPAMAKNAGVDVLMVSAYQGGLTLSDIKRIIIDDSKFDNIFNFSSRRRKWEAMKSMPISSLLGCCDWDVVILQRAAPGKTGGSDRWTTDMEDDLSFILDYIKLRIRSDASVLFNTCFSRPVNSFSRGREEQLVQTELIVSSSLIIQNRFDVEVIPSAYVIQYARNTDISYFPTTNSSHFSIPDITGDGHHLDTGLGSYILGCLLFEQVCGSIWGISIIDNDYVPSLSDVHGFVFDDKYYTQITREEATIAKTCVISAYNNYRRFVDSMND